MGKRSRRHQQEPREETLIEEVRDEYRRQKKILKHNFNLAEVSPLTDNQDSAFHANGSTKHLLLYGVAGTGKTFLAAYFALSDLFYDVINFHFRRIRSSLCLAIFLTAGCFGVLRHSPPRKRPTADSTLRHLFSPTLLVLLDT